MNLFIFIICFYPGITLGQNFEVPDDFIDAPLVHEYKKPMKGIMRIVPIKGVFSKYTSIELSQIESRFIDPTKWLKDNLEDQLGSVAETERILQSPDSPFLDPNFDWIRHMLPKINETIDTLANNPLSFCEGPNLKYNRSGELEEIFCIFKFGLFRHYLILRLQNNDGIYYFTKIETLNERRLITLLTIADTFKVGTN